MFVVIYAVCLLFSSGMLVWILVCVELSPESLGKEFAATAGTFDVRMGAIGATERSFDPLKTSCSGAILVISNVFGIRK